MTNKFIYILVSILFSLTNLYSQNLNLDEFEIYIGDTLIAKSDFIKNGRNLTEEQSKKLEFKPIVDGDKKTYYLNGKLYSEGKITNNKKDKFWVFWHSNGNKAREGDFIKGKQNGTHKYWYPNGILRGIGNWKNGIYEGVWETYSDDGKEKKIEVYENGVKIK